MKLIYLNPEDTSVMEAQVLSLLEYYKKLNAFTDIILLQGCKNKPEEKILDRKLEKFQFNMIWFKRWPSYTFFQSFAFSSISKVLDNLKLDDQSIIHVRGELYGYIVHKYIRIRKLNVKLLIDLRGVAIEEVNNYYSHNFLLKKNKVLLLRKSYNGIKKNLPITVVSEAFKKYLIENHEFKEQNICVHPNIAGKQFIYSRELRLKIRTELQLKESDIVAICSSNGGSAWQKDKDVILPLLALKVKVINLSKTSQDIPGVINKLVPFELMPAYLSAADIAVLWRDDNVVNEVASPSKFSEFAAMGLWIIHNGTVQIAADFIHQNKTGLIVNSVNDITMDQIRFISSYNRKDCSIIGRKVFGVENIGGSYIKHYEKLIQ